MKYFFFLSAGIFFSVFSYSQNVKINTNGDPSWNKLKVSLLGDKLFITDKDLLVPVANLRALDSLVKRLPDPKSLTIHLDTENADPEKIRAVVAVLNKCRCHVTEHSISFNKN